MFEQEKKELFDLCLRVKEETNAYLRVSYCTDTYMTLIIQDDGYDPGKKFDGDYGLYEDLEMRDIAMKNYQKAKEHIIRLLENGRCPV